MEQAMFTFIRTVEQAVYCAGVRTMEEAMLDDESEWWTRQCYYCGESENGTGGVFFKVDIV